MMTASLLLGLERTPSIQASPLPYFDAKKLIAVAVYFLANFLTRQE